MNWLRTFFVEDEEPEPGDERVLSGFLWVPKAVLSETRWLVTATWRERYVWTGRGARERKAWRAVQWIDEGKVQERSSEAANDADSPGLGLEEAA